MFTLTERDWKALKIKDLLEHPSFNFVYIVLDKKIKETSEHIDLLTQDSLHPKTVERVNELIEVRKALTWFKQDLVNSLQSLADDKELKFADIPSAYNKGSNSEWRIKWMKFKTLINLRPRLAQKPNKPK